MFFFSAISFLLFKVVLVVNVASECGYTDGHYKALVRLQDKLGSTEKFTVLAFPCNQFGNQEPGVSIAYDYCRFLIKPEE